MIFGMGAHDVCVLESETREQRFLERKKVCHVESETCFYPSVGLIQS